MKKLKLVVSDLHLGVGKVVEGRLNPMEEFYYDDKFSEFLNYYSNGEFAESEVELILNGDIFNFLQIDYRGHYLTVITESMCMDHLKRIVQGHAPFFAAIKRFLKNGKNSVTYIVGNHDQGMLWPSVRAHLNEVLGMPVRYKNIVYFFDGVHIEHGHMYEAANRINPKKFFLRKNLPEPILNLPFGSYFFIDFVLKIKMENPHIDKVRPFKASVRWNLFQDTFFTIKTILQLIWYFVRSIFGFGTQRRWAWKKLVGIFFEGAIFPDLSAAGKKILEDARVHTVIFGHTHVYQYRQFGDKEYFNTGTWTELTSLDINSLGKITKLTYVAIEYPESVPDQALQPRARLKEWRGYHRIEADIDIS